jgi:hypothetical protein
VIAGGFVGSFIEASDQVLKDQAHGDVVNLAGMQVEFGELGYDLIQPVGFFQLLNLFFKLETLKNLADILGKAIDVVDQVATDVVWIALQLLKIELAVSAFPSSSLARLLRTASILAMPLALSCS